MLQLHQKWILLQFYFWIFKQQIYNNNIIYRAVMLFVMLLHSLLFNLFLLNMVWNTQVWIHTWEILLHTLYITLLLAYFLSSEYVKVEPNWETANICKSGVGSFAPWEVPLGPKSEMTVWYLGSFVELYFFHSARNEGDLAFHCPQRYFYKSCLKSDSWVL